MGLLRGCVCTKGAFGPDLADGGGLLVWAGVAARLVLSVKPAASTRAPSTIPKYHSVRLVMKCFLSELDVVNHISRTARSRFRCMDPVGNSARCARADAEPVRSVPMAVCPPPRLTSFAL